MRNKALPAGHKNGVHLKQLRKSDPVKKRKKSNKGPPSIQSIIQAIMNKEEAPKSPRSPRNAKAVKQVLGITSQQEAVIANQKSPRLRAKAVSAAILGMRPLTSCAKAMSSPRSQFRARGQIMQPRQGF